MKSFSLFLLSTMLFFSESGMSSICTPGCKEQLRFCTEKNCSTMTLLGKKRKECIKTNCEYIYQKCFTDNDCEKEPLPGEPPLPKYPSMQSY